MDRRWFRQIRSEIKKETVTGDLEPKLFSYRLKGNQFFSFLVEILKHFKILTNLHPQLLFSDFRNQRFQLLFRMVD